MAAEIVKELQNVNKYKHCIKDRFIMPKFQSLFTSIFRGVNKKYMTCVNSVISFYLKIEDLKSWRKNIYKIEDFISWSYSIPIVKILQCDHLGIQNQSTTHFNSFSPEAVIVVWLWSDVRRVNALSPGEPYILKLTKFWRDIACHNKYYI